MTPDFHLFWDEFPKQRRVNKPGAFKAFQKALKVASFTEIMTGLEGYKTCEDVVNGFACMPTTWLNQQRWEMEYERAKPKLDKSVYLSILKRKKDGAYIMDSEQAYLRAFEQQVIG